MMELKILDKFSSDNNFLNKLFSKVRWEDRNLIIGNKEDDFEKDLAGAYCTINKKLSLARNINQLLKVECKRNEKRNNEHIRSNRLKEI